MNDDQQRKGRRWAGCYFQLGLILVRWRGSSTQRTVRLIHRQTPLSVAPPGLSHFVPARGQGVYWVDYKLAFLAFKITKEAKESSR